MKINKILWQINIIKSFNLLQVISLVGIMAGIIIMSNVAKNLSLINKINILI